MWEQEGVKWKQNNAIGNISVNGSPIASKTYDNGKLLTIYYCMEQNYSAQKKKMEATDNSQQTIKEAYFEAVNKLFGDNKFVYLCNIVDDDYAEKTLRNGIKLPNNPDGINDYRDLDYAAVFSALNFTPNHSKFIKNQFSIDFEECRESIFYSKTIQAIMRISLRDPKSITKKYIVVPDKQVANYIAKLFSGSKIKLLPSNITNNKAMRIFKGGRNVKINDRKNAEFDRNTLLTGYGYELNENSGFKVSPCNRYIYNNVIPKSHFSFYKEGTNIKDYIKTSMLSISGKQPCAHIDNNISCHLASEHVLGFDVSYTPKTYNYGTMYFDTYDELSDWLRLQSQRQITSKYLNLLISPSVFKKMIISETINGKRHRRTHMKKEECVIHSSGIWLDIDGGTMSPDDLANIFPQYRMIIYSTSSNGKIENGIAQRKYRVCIPTDHTINVPVYKSITKKIIDTIEEQGYSSEKKKRDFIKDYVKQYNITPSDDVLKSNGLDKIHGIDSSKTKSNDFFFIPAQSLYGGKDKTFFYDFKDNGREMIDVIKSVEELAREIIPGKRLKEMLDDGKQNNPTEETEEKTTYYNEQKVQDIKSDYYAQPINTGHLWLYQYGIALGCTNMPIMKADTNDSDSVESMLYDAINHIPYAHQTENKSNIDNILKDVQQNRNDYNNKTK